MSKLTSFVWRKLNRLPFPEAGLGYIVIGASLSLVLPTPWGPIAAATMILAEWIAIELIVALSNAKKPPYTLQHWAQFFQLAFIPALLVAALKVGVAYLFVRYIGG